jgi:hypothetical protein
MAALLFHRALSNSDRRERVVFRTHEQTLLHGYKANTPLQYSTCNMPLNDMPLNYSQDGLNLLKVFRKETLR